MYSSTDKRKINFSIKKKKEKNDLEDSSLNS